MVKYDCGRVFVRPSSSLDADHSALYVPMGLVASAGWIMVFVVPFALTVPSS